MSPRIPSQATAYDEVEYAARPHLSTHPDRLATIARIYGLNAPDPRRCRVLELGCSDGGNLLAMSFALPESSFLGVDFAHTAVDAGNALIAELGVGNVQLRWADLLDLDETLGTFEYIVAHGVFSWVPAPVRRKLLAICQACLAPNGVAYVSYNAYPGCSARQMARDLMLFHVRGVGDPEARIGQALNYLSQVAAAQPPGSAYRLALEGELTQLANAGTSFVYHDALSSENQPFYFEEFAEQAALAGLQFLSEAQFFESFEAGLLVGHARALPAVSPPDVVRSEQYLDHLKGRSFRQTLLVQRGHALDRSLDPSHLPGLFAVARFQRSTPEGASVAAPAEQFTSVNGVRITTASVIAKATFDALSDAWPAALGHAELLVRVLEIARPENARAVEDELGSLLLRCHASRAIELRSTQVAFEVRPGRLPRATSLARQQARSGDAITNLSHAQVGDLDPLARILLGMLDGSKQRAELARALNDSGAASLALPVTEAELERLLNVLAGHRMLLRSDLTSA